MSMLIQIESGWGNSPCTLLVRRVVSAKVSPISDVYHIPCKKGHVLAGSVESMNPPKLYACLCVYLFSRDGPLYSLILKVIWLWFACLKEECLDDFEHLQGHDYYNFELVYLKSSWKQDVLREIVCVCIFDQENIVLSKEKIPF